MVDLEKFFDRMNHGVLMTRGAWRIEDKRILRLISRYLQSGMMEADWCRREQKGRPKAFGCRRYSVTPLDELNKELERRGHRFVCYAVACTFMFGRVVRGNGLCH